MNRPWSLISFFLIYALTVPAVAQTSSTATSMATGGTGRASVEASDIHELNPAMLVHLKGRDLHSAVLEKSWILGVTDNSFDTVVPAGLSITRGNTQINGLRTDIDDLRLTLAGFVSKNVSFGVTGKQLELRRNGTSTRQANVDLGFSWISSPKLGLALVVYDPLSPNRELDPAFRSEVRTAVGLNYLFREFVGLRADYLSAAGNDFGDGSLLLGYEASLNRYFQLRVGYGFEREYDREVGSLGVGMDLPRFRLNYGYQTAVKSVDDFDNRHSIDLGIPF